jgi:hypothetical protein
MSLQRIQTLIEECKNDNDRLFDLNVKCCAAKLRKNLQEISNECKQLRKLALDHRKSLPVKKRKPKTDDETKEEKKDDELPPPVELKREVTSTTTAQEAVDIEKERAELKKKLALLDSDKK